MALWKKAFALTMLTALPIAGYSICTATWSGTTSGAWNDVSNWGGVCIPGSIVTNTDSATFGSVVGVSSTISLITVPIQPGLNILDFNNSSTSFTITGNSSDYLQFNGASSSLNIDAGNHQIQAPIRLNNTVLAVTINSSCSLTYQGLLTDLGTSSMNLTGAGQFVNNMGSITLAGDFSASGGSLTNQNSVAVTGTIGSLISAANFTFTNVNVMNTNNVDTVNAGGTGVELLASSTLTINGGSLTNSNSGTPIGNTSRGSVVSASDLIVNNGQFINTNSGQTIGSHDVGAFVQVANNLTLNGGALSSTNTAHITGSSDRGSLIEVGSNFTINGGASVRNTNSGSVTGSSALGSVIRANQILINNGSLSNNDIVQANSVNIGNAGVLSGSGIYQDQSGGATTQIVNGGRMVLGDASFTGNAGTINIQGSYQQQPGGTLVAHLGSSSSLLQVTGTPGTATLAGTIEADFIAGTINLANTFTVLNASNGISGTFSSVTVPNNPNVLGHVQYTGNSAILSFSPIIPPNPTPNPTIATTPATFPNIVTPHVVFASASTFFTATSQRQAQLERRLYSGETEEGSIAATSIPEQRGSMADISSGLLAANDVGTENPLAFARKVDSLLADDASQQQEQLKRRLLAAKKTEPPAKFYIGPQGTLGKALSIDYWQAGAIAGFDYAFKEAGVGIGVIANFTHSVGKGFKIDEWAANFYGVYQPKPQPHLTINWTLGGAWDWYDFRSTTGFASAPKIAKGTTSGPQFKAQLGLKYTFQHDQFSSIPEKLEISPIISAQYDRAFVKKFRQHGADQFNMSLSSIGANDFRTTLGTHVYYSWDWENFSVSPDFYVAWQREFLLKDTTMTARPILISGPPSTIVIPGIGRNIAQAAFDLILKFYQVYELEGNYSFEWNSAYHTNNLYFTFNYHF